MNYFAQQKWLKWTVAVLIASNLAILSLLLFRPKPPWPPHKHGKPEDFIIKELELNEDQIEEYELLIDVHRAFMDDLVHQRLERKANYFKGLGTEDSEKAEAELRAILDIQRQQEELTYKHFEKLRSILSPTQQEKFDGIISKVIDGMMKLPPPPGSPGAPPPPPH